MLPIRVSVIPSINKPVFPPSCRWPAISACRRSSLAAVLILIASSLEDGPLSNSSLSSLSIYRFALMHLSIILMARFCNSDHQIGPMCPSKMIFGKVKCCLESLGLLNRVNSLPKQYKTIASSMRCEGNVSLNFLIAIISACLRATKCPKILFF